MSIIPASRLSLSDVALLGNNLVPDDRFSRPRRSHAETASRQILAAVQRSLASVGESVSELCPVTISIGGHCGQ